MYIKQSVFIKNDWSIGLPAWLQNYFEWRTQSNINESAWERCISYFHENNKSIINLYL